MSKMPWVLVEAAAHLLEPKEREAVLGDLMESRESAWAGLRSVIGLAARRQVRLWMNWRPWVSTFGLSAPASLHLMGISVGFCLHIQRLMELPSLAARPHAMVAFLLGPAIQLLACSWACGYAMGAISRRTLWASILACAIPGFACFMVFRMPSLPRVSLFLFLPPAVCGLVQALRGIRLNRILVLAAALAVTASLLLPISAAMRLGFWLNMLMLPLYWPIWYVAVSSMRKRKEAVA